MLPSRMFFAKRMVSPWVLFNSIFKYFLVRRFEKELFCVMYL